VGLETYHRIQTKAPWLQHLYFQLIECQQLFNSNRVAFGQEYFVGLLEEMRPDVILSVHDCLNLGYLEIAKLTLGSKVVFATYCDEFGGGYGFSRNWVNRGVNYFFGRTMEVCREAARRGVSPGKIFTAGHWAHPSFYQTPLIEQEKLVVLRELGLCENRFTLLLSTGGAGAQHHIEYLNALLPLQERLQVIALCGRSLKSEQELSHWKSEHSSFALKVLPYTDSMSVLLQVASAVIARPGAATCGEALLSKCPIIFDVIGGIMPHELPNWRYFKKRRIGHLLSRAEKLPTLLDSWWADPILLNELKSRMALCPSDETPILSLRRLLEVE
jgi:processive 1,2-diacylglycerol beta-glucosyltransferase